MYDFQHPSSRHSDGSIKYSKPGVIPMWIADMDFELLPEITQAMQKRLEIPFFGYTAPSPAYYASVAGWMKRRHDWEIEPEWIVPVPGIVPAIKMLLLAMTKENDGVLIFPPVYHPFAESIEMNHRVPVRCPLLEKDGTYEIDFDALESLLEKEKPAAVILCSPHNPTGNAWSEKQLKQLGELFEKHSMQVISDEIHMDFSRGSRHIPFLNACPELKDRTVVCTAPTKTFNLAALQVSNLVIPDETLREKVKETMDQIGMQAPNVLGLTACQAAYEHGDVWVDELNQAIENNIEYVRSFLARRLPQIKMADSQGLYLVWLDFRALQKSDEELDRFLKEKAGLFLSPGIQFGKEGSGWMRMNLACPFATVRQAMESLEQAIAAL